MKKRYDYKLEYKNITNYSPFCHINELPLRYRRQKFQLPIVKYEGKMIPMHPDTFKILKLDKKIISHKVTVYPTSSFRTVFYPEKSICWKLSLKRKITRGIRDLEAKQLERSQTAQRELAKYNCKNFSFLSEKCFYSNNSDYNYIERKMPEGNAFPLFFVISRNTFSKKIILKIINNIIYSWFFWASKKLYLEYHSQNILVRKNGDLIYRDLSDVRSEKYKKLIPDYYSHVKNKCDYMSLIFDRSVCDQNLEHFDRYKKFNKNDILTIKKWILRYSQKFGITLPEHSCDFEPDLARRIPIQKEINRWRKK